MSALLQRALQASATWAPEPAHVATVALLAVAMVTGSSPLFAVVVGLCLYGIAHEATRPELEHVYCPCDICTTPPTETNGDDPR